MGSPMEFARVRTTAAWSLSYLAMTVLWVLVGDPLPGGRWLAVHLFTLGVLTNAIVGFGGHFARALTHRREPVPRWWPPALNLGIVLILAGIPTATPWAVAAGSALVTAVILLSYRRLRRIRRSAPEARFAWIVRTYERAHGAFVHGALLGALVGTGVLTGSWAGSARLAHLHVNLLGWAGLTLLATLAFFGPTMARTRILTGADRRSGAALRQGATGLTVGVVALLITGAGGTLATGARLLGGVALAAYASAATAVCLPVVRAALRARPSFERALVVALGSWFPVVIWADVAVVLSGEYRFLDAVGAALLLGVLGQAFLAAMSYFAPELRTADRPARDGRPTVPLGTVAAGASPRPQLGHRACGRGGGGAGREVGGCRVEGWLGAGPGHGPWAGGARCAPDSRGPADPSTCLQEPVARLGGRPHALRLRGFARLGRRAVQ